MWLIVWVRLRGMIGIGIGLFMKSSGSCGIILFGLFEIMNGSAVGMFCTPSEDRTCSVFSPSVEAGGMDKMGREGSLLRAVGNLVVVG